MCPLAASREATPTRWAGGSRASCHPTSASGRSRSTPPGFDARFSPLWRRYAYRLTEHPFGPEPLHRHDVVAHGRPPLDLGGDAKPRPRALLGDTTSRPSASGATARRRPRPARAALVAQPATSSSRVLADAFCHSMVRSLVGALLAVGEGRRPANWPAQVLAGRRAPARTSSSRPRSGSRWKRSTTRPTTR